MAEKKPTAPEAEKLTAAGHPKGYWDEKVPVFLFKDGDRYKDDVTVGVNGEFIRIQRGKQVLVKRKFAKVLEQSMEQDAATAEMIARADGQARNLGL